MPNQNAYTMSPTKSTATLKTREGLSIENLVRDHFTAIRRLAVSILNDADEAEDAVQETFIAAHRALPDFRAHAEVKTWLYAITINNCRGRLRKRKVREALQKTLNALHNQNTATSAIEALTADREADRQLWQAVDSLDEKHRLPILLRYLHGMRIAEIAEVLNVNVGTIHSRLHYARHTLQTRLGHLNSREEVTDETFIPR
jgi:RNA polymerase sigma-70 factor (ECF subfamily)